MKKLFSISILLILAISTFAQLPQKKKVYTLGAIYDNGTAAQTFSTFNAAFADTLKSGSAADTVFFKVLINHVSLGFPYISLNTKLVSAGQDTTATVTFWQSIDGSTNWQQLKQVTNVVAFDTTKFYGMGAPEIAWDTTKTTLKTIGKGQLYTYKTGFKGYGPYTQSTTPTETAFTVTIAKGTGGTDVSFWRKGVKFESQYLGIQIIAPSRTGHKTIYSGTVKFQKAN
jgi:hypothetical protein